MSLKYDLLADLNKSANSFNPKRFSSTKTYFSTDGYKLSHYGTWRITFKNSFLFSESDKSFWPFVEMLEFRLYECTDTVGEDVDNFDTEIDEDSNFLPSLGIDFESPKGSGHKSLRHLLGFIA